tara:strand:+ start:631 stop:774 length:144 start_codon:yes stop_codon:yes gene_type:complete
MDFAIGTPGEAQFKHGIRERCSKDYFQPGLQTGSPLKASITKEKLFL